MARAYSIDLRKRVVEAVTGGLSTRAAARQFSIGISDTSANQPKDKVEKADK